jgi:hypothetical protein
MYLCLTYLLLSFYDSAISNNIKKNNFVFEIFERQMEKMSNFLAFKFFRNERKREKMWI